jgi:glycosyltransferase involved in cell wall biosynthesis
MIPNTRPRVVLTALGMVPSTGGPAKTVGNFQQALGAQVVSFTPRNALAAEGTAIPGAVHVPVDGGWAGRSFLWAGAAARQEADGLAVSADLLSCHILYRYHAHWVGQWARRRRIPYWVVPHGCLDPYVFTYRATVKRAWMAVYGRRFLAGARHVIFSTEMERRKAAAQHDGANTRVVHWPVAPIDAAGADEIRARARERLQLREDDRLLLYLGRLHAMKRPVETVQAVAAAKRDHVHLMVLGPDETVTAQEILAAGERLGLGARIRAPGPVYGAAKLEWLLASDGFISLSHRENFGHSAAEALAAGRPVILSPGVDLGAELAPHRCGWFLEDDQIETAAAAIREWADAPAEELRARGQRGRELMRREYTFEHFAGQLQALAAEAVAAS